MKSKAILPIIVTVLISLACQALTQPVSTPTEEPSPQPQATKEQPTATLEPVTQKSLAGLIISSPALGTAPGPYMGDLPIKGLGIFNQNGQLIKITEAGILKGYLPSGPYIVYQFYAIESASNDRLRSFDIGSGESVEIDSELRGEKTILGWLASSPSKFIFENNLEWYLFEAYGYFEGREILLADAETGQASLLLEHTFQSDLNPARTKLAYTTGLIGETSGEHMQEGAGCFQPQIFDLATSTSSEFDTTQLPEIPLCLGYPNWSPDGQKIAWVGYFPDDTFRTVIFDVSDGKGTFYDEMDIFAGTQFRSGWNLGEAMWLDNSTFWTEDYEINIETGETTMPREDPTPFEPDFSSYLASATRPDGFIAASIGDGDGVITIEDLAGNQLATFSLDQLYGGERNDYGFDETEFLSTFITGWAPFAPEPGVESNFPPVAPAPTKFTCPNAPPTRLQVGDTARITFTDGTSTFLRSKPEAGDNIIDKLPEGTEFEITAGPVCYPRPGRNDAYVYWEISVPSRNTSGWVAEGDATSYYLEPWP